MVNTSDALASAPKNHSLRKEVVFLWIISTLLCAKVYAQGEANIWYFGDSAGLDFNFDPPIPLSNSSMDDVLEGCASVSDAQGNLLFYTNGETIWNKNHQVMVNGSGLIGSGHPRQGRMIVKKPGSSSIYYFFHAKSIISARELRYSEVDLSLQGGLGQVTTNKNILIAQGVGEALTATRHGNGVDFWVTFNECCSAPRIRSFLVSSTGVSATMVDWNGSFVHAPPAASMKHSPLGDRLVVLGSALSVFDFDNLSGNLTLKYYLYSQISGGYGVEISPNGRFVYVSQLINPVSSLNQFDLWSLDSTSFALSNHIVQNNIALRSLQLAPNGKIYAAKSYSNKLGVIHRPNCPGDSCLFQDSAQTLGFGTSRLGLPQFPAGFSKQLVSNVYDTCFQDTAVFTMSGYLVNIDSVHWNFDDTATGLLNMANGDSVTHVFSQPGTFQVTMEVFTSPIECTYSESDTLFDTISVTIHPPPEIFLGNDTILCEGDSLVIQSSNTYLPMTYLWSDFSTNASLTVHSPDTFWVEVTSLCGVDFDTVVIDSVLKALVDLGPDTLVCVGDTVWLDATVAGGVYQWQNGDLDSTFEVVSSGLYSVMATGICNVDLDTVRIDFINPYVDQLPDDTTVCDGNIVAFDLYADSAVFQWDNGSDTTYISTGISDTFQVTITNACGVFYDSLKTIIDFPIQVDLGQDTLVCEGTFFWLHKPIGISPSLLWQNGDTLDSMLVAAAGIYWLEAANTCGVYDDTLYAEYDRSPEISLPNDMLLCTGTVMPLSVAFSRSNYKWNTGSIDSLIEVTEEGDYVVTATNLCGSDSAAVRIDFDFPLDFELGDALFGCEGTPIILGVEAPHFPKYLWNTGHSGPYLDVSESGKYILTITNTCGPYVDDVVVVIDPKPNIGFPDDTVLCGTTKLKLEPTTTFSNYMWQDSTVSRTLEVSEAGTYWLQAVTRCGTDRDTIRVNYSKGAAINLGIDTFICQEFGTIELSAYDSNTRHYLWSNDLVSESITVYEPGTYAVTVTDRWNCDNDDQITIGDCPVRLFIPGSFTPNADGLNDVFKVEGEYLSEFHLMIFNRWGELVFKTDDMTQGWDGTIKDKPAPNHMYTYRLRYKPDSDLMQERTGSVVLAR